jgi:hypothetical protein
VGRGVRGLKSLHAACTGALAAQTSGVVAVCSLCCCCCHNTEHQTHF